MLIKVSKSLIKTIKNFRLSDWNEQVSDQEIFNKIKRILVFDRIIKQEDSINFEIISKQFQGVLIPDKKQIIHFCQMATIDGRTRSRNTFLSQNFGPTSDLADELNYSISISLNPYDLDKRIHIPSFVSNTIKELLTLGVTINNSLNRLGNFSKFIDINDFLRSRETLRNRNTGNKSTLLQINNIINSITVYGRLDGANGKNTILACKIILALATKNSSLDFYNVTPNENYSNSSIEKIKNLGFVINNTTSNEDDLINRIGQHRVSVQEILPRDQDTFKANIIKKYLANPNFDIHKCMACNYNVESNFIASHIHRYADILSEFKENKITAKEAAHLIVSGDNGFLLCPNQDKEFEKGQIYFDIKSKKFVANEIKLTESEYDLVNKNIKCSNFSNIMFTKEFISNIEKHHKRIGL